MKLESPSPKDALCQVGLKLQRFLRSRFFLNFVNVFFLFRNYLPLEKGRTLHLRKLKSPLPNDALCKVWLKLTGGSGEEDENVNSLRLQQQWRQQRGRRRRRRQRGRTSDKFWSEKLTCAFGSGELKTSSFFHTNKYAFFWKNLSDTNK